MLRELPHDGAFALLGESFSGPVAVAVAARSAPVALILACSFVINPRPALAPLAPLLAWLPAPGRWLHLLASFALLGRHATPDLRRALARAIRAVAPDVMRHRAASVQRVDVRPALAFARCPVLYLQASEDRIVPPTCAVEVIRIRPDAMVASIEGPHCLLQARPEAVADAVAGFLRRVEEGSPVAP